MKTPPKPLSIKGLESGNVLSYRTVAVEGGLLVRLGVVGVQDDGLPTVEASMEGQGSCIVDRFNALQLKGILLGSSVIVRDAPGAEDGHFGVTPGVIVPGEMVIMQTVQDGDLVHAVLPTPDPNTLEIE